MEGEINDSNRIYFWRFYLVKDKNISHFLTTDFDLPNQRVIKSDVLRTKNDMLTEEDKLDLEILLTSYCKNEDVRYK
jgi:hypothetical protein